MVKGLRKFLDDPKVTAKEISERKALSVIASPLSLYISEHKPALVEKMLADKEFFGGMKPTKGIANLQKFGKQELNKLPEEERASIFERAAASRAVLLERVREFRNVRPRGGGNKKAKRGAAADDGSDLPPGWRVSPAGEGYIRYFYTRVGDIFIVNQMKPQVTTELRPNGVPLPPNGLMRSSTKEQIAARKAAKAAAAAPKEASDSGDDAGADDKEEASVRESEMPDDE
jgi:hypothetical protein